MEGPRASKPAISATIERKTRFTILTKVANKTAIEKTQALFTGMSSLPKDLIKSITVDNGKENTHHQNWSTHFNAPTYFCHAYHSWEKGSVENSIGRIRRFIPKGTDLSLLTPTQLNLLQDWLNHTPRKCLGWKTPYEALREELQTAL
jgi:IS30 family transposase